MVPPFARLDSLFLLGTVSIVIKILPNLLQVNAVMLNVQGRVGLKPQIVLIAQEVRHVMRIVIVLLGRHYVLGKMMVVVWDVMRGQCIKLVDRRDVLAVIVKPAKPTASQTILPAFLVKKIAPVLVQKHVLVL